MAPTGTAKHQIGPMHSLGHAGAGLINDAQFACALAGFFGGAEADDASHQTSLAGGQGKGAAHQAATNQGEALKVR